MIAKQGRLPDGPTRQHLLDAARSVFRRRRYRASKVSDIVRHAGVAQGTFYRYFDSKEDAFLELSRGLRRKMADAIEQADDSSQPFPERLRASVAAVFACSRENVDLVRLLNFEFDPGFATPELQAEALRHAPTVAYRRRMFAEAVESGEIAPVDTEIAAKLVTGVVRAALLEALVVGDVTKSHAVEAHVSDMLAAAFPPVAVPSR